MLSVKIIIQISQILIEKPLKNTYDMQDKVLSNVLESTFVRIRLGTYQRLL